MKGKTDRATEFSLAYLDILEKRLDIRFNEYGPFSTTATDTHTLTKLRSELLSLFNDNLRHNAIIDARTYGQEHVQTVGFGLPQDFDKFAKMGFLCGSRLVFWDLIGTRLLGSIDNKAVRTEAIKLTASNLLSLKSIVQDGGLIILPHPHYWSEEACYRLEQLSKENEKDPAKYGLVSALSVLGEIPLHPYTLFPGKSVNWPKHPIELKDNDYYPPESYVFHKALDDTFEDTRFAYLNNVSAADFYKVVSKDMTIQAELRKLFSPSSGRLSSQQLFAESQAARDSLAKKIDKRNKRITSNSIGTVGTTIAFVAAFATVINTATLATNTQLGIAITELSATLLALFSRVFEKEEQNVVVQAFVDISRAPQPRI